MIEYPEYIKVNKKRYRINTDYKVALRALELLDSEDISDWERSIGLVVLLFGSECPVNNESLELARKYLQCGETNTEHSSRDVDMDLNHDSKYIVASFQKEYGMDITEEDLHWWKFYSLLGGLGEDCILTKVRMIRNEDLGDYKDKKTRRKLMEAKKAVALPVKYTKEETRKREEFMKKLWGDNRRS